MKRLFLLLFFVFGLVFTLFAETFNQSFGTEIILKEINEALSNPTYGTNDVLLKEYLFHHDYTTKQYIPFEMDEDYGQDAESNPPEARTTAEYKKAFIYVPKGSKIVDYVFFNNEGKLVFPSSKAIELNVNGREVKFQLDYAINFARSEDRQYFKDNYYDFDFQDLSKPVVIRITYSPKYFTLHQYEAPYSGHNVFNITDDKGKNISLETVTHPIFQVQNQEGKITYLVLDPNSDFKNIYEDFKFVRGGNK